MSKLHYSESWKCYLAKCFIPKWQLSVTSAFFGAFLRNVSSQLDKFFLKQLDCLTCRNCGGIVTLISALKEGKVIIAANILPRLFLQVCELVKFMIEHCQQILGHDPSSLFGGPPLKPTPEETGSGLKTLVFFSSFPKKKNMLLHQSSIFTPQTGCTRWPIHPTTV